MFVRSINPIHHNRLEIARTRLNAFYSNNPDYFTLSTSSDKTKFLAPIAERAASIARTTGNVRILEVGAGISQVPSFMQRHLKGLSYQIVLQDVVEDGRQTAEASGAHFFHGPVWEITASEPFDIVISLFSYEHMYEPTRILDALDMLVRPGGIIYIAAPHYVTPLYVPPAIRHREQIGQLAGSFFLWIQSWIVLFSGRANFYVVDDPAVFHRQWRRDADAVHMVSRADLIAHMKHYKVRSLRTSGTTLKTRLLEKAILLFVALEKDQAP